MEKRKRGKRVSVTLFYRSIVAQELAEKIHYIRLNGSILKTLVGTVVDRNIVTTKTETITGLSVITKIECLDQNMETISSKDLNILLTPNKVVDFEYSWEVN
ncbi:hypothetical protein [Exiguobacterium sp. s142]|uniref:hypothetical protein n=1 Tax=Exiguobacterium sp. s142 TaxID=2751222 RepID=UPI001BE86191|nr:hypothetical protein [Exiguobacterium sp. s142]